MAKFVYKSALVTLGGTSLSAYVIDATLKRGVDTPEGTAMGSTTHTSMAGGLLTESVTIQFFQNHATGTVDDTLDGARTTAAEIVLTPTGSGPDADNPTYTGDMLVSDYDPMSGTVGDRAVCTAVFVPTEALTRTKA
jgi:hypothetical protein